MKIEDLDLSYSGLVDVIQSNKEDGFTVLESIFEGIAAQKKVVNQFEKELQHEINTLNYYKAGIGKVIKHLEIKPPFNFVFGSTIYAINESGDFTTFEVSNK